ncbi:MAG: FHA domain-containing protein, partial [Pseudomonadales bacterium]|nr:FHA domain-containing protein [Pseudomonadales bacterium]
MALLLRVSLEGRAVGSRTLADGSFVIGRHPDCEVVLADPAVSARHARLLVVGEACTAEDLQSTNGTFVNGHRVTRQVLDHGDVLTLGAHRLRFERIADPPAPARLEPEDSSGPARPLEKRVTLLGRRGVQVLAVHRRADHDRL